MMLNSSIQCSTNATAPSSDFSSHGSGSAGAEGDAVLGAAEGCSSNLGSGSPPHAERVAARARLDARAPIVRLICCLPESSAPGSGRASNARRTTPERATSNPAAGGEPAKKKRYGSRYPADSPTPDRSRTTSTRTLCATTSSNGTDGSHPSCSRALVGSPTSSATSAGRINAGSCDT